MSVKVAMHVAALGAALTLVLSGQASGAVGNSSVYCAPKGHDLMILGGIAGGGKGAATPTIRVARGTQVTRARAAGPRGRRLFGYIVEAGNDINCATLRPRGQSVVTAVLPDGNPCTERDLESVLKVAFSHGRTEAEAWEHWLESGCPDD